jgi:hypothetical protein
VPDRNSIKQKLEHGLSFALEAARDLRTLINRLDSHDEPSMLDLADVSATLQAGALAVLKATPEVAD